MTKKIVLAIFGVLYLILSFLSANDGGDFDVFLNAAVQLENGNNIYIGPFIDGLQYYYSPLFALILIPFTENIFVVELIWLVLSGIWMVRIWILVSRYFEPNSLSVKEQNIWLVVSFFFIVRFILYNIAMIQVTIFLLWAILESFRLIRNGKNISGGGLLALVINIKLMPLVVIPYLIYRGYFKALVWIAFFSVVWIYLPGLFVGHEFNMVLLEEWWKIINPGNSEHLIEAEITYQSLVGTIPVYLTETESIIELKRNVVNLPVDLVMTITNLARLILAGFTLYFLGLPFRKAKNKLSDIWAISYLLVAIPLIFPHQQKYAFLFSFPMITYLVYAAIIQFKYDKSTSTKVFIGALITLLLVFTPIIGSDIIGRYFYDVIQHYRILGICTVLLIPFFVWASPNKLNELRGNSTKTDY